VSNTFNNSREKQLETCLVIATALLVIWYFASKEWLVYIAIVVGLIGAFVPVLSKWLHWAWFKLAEGMGWVMSKVILTIVFYGILFPISILYRMGNKDALQLKRKPNGCWTERNHQYLKKDLENLW
jgi:Saxitoxin biosynthesis operon protein SxtJ